MTRYNQRQVGVLQNSFPIVSGHVDFVELEKNGFHRVYLVDKLRGPFADLFREQENDSDSRLFTEKYSFQQVVNEARKLAEISLRDFQVAIKRNFVVANYRVAADHTWQDNGGKLVVYEF